MVPAARVSTMVAIAAGTADCHTRAARAWLARPAGQRGGLPHPGGQLRFVELVVLVDVEVAHFLMLGPAGGDRTQRHSAEESHLDVLREAMEAEEPALARNAIERRVPFDCLAHAGNGVHDERVEAASDVPLPARHGRDVGLHGGVAIGLCNLRVAACEEGRTCNLARPRLCGRVLRSLAAFVATRSAALFASFTDFL